MITIASLHKQLAGVPVLRGIDLRVERGEVLAIIGPSGTGKSVLLKHIIGLLEPDQGDVLINDTSVTRASYAELSILRRSMGYVFQDAALLDSLDVETNLRLALDDRDADQRRRIMDALALVNLDASVLPKFPRELSGGMRKRVGVARAIINQPAVLLYDEPTTGLDPRNVDAINDLVLSNRSQLGATSIVVTHDIPSLRFIADRVALIAQGAIRFLGTPAELHGSTDPFVLDFISLRAEAA